LARRACSDTKTTKATSQADRTREENLGPALELNTKKVRANAVKLGTSFGARRNEPAHLYQV